MGINIIKGYAAINTGTYWIGVIQGDIYCKIGRKYKSQALRDAELVFSKSFLNNKLCNKKSKKLKSLQ